MQTLEPLGLPIEIDDRLAEGASRRDSLASLVEHDGCVACTHGDVVENVLGRSLKKGAAAVLDVANGVVRVEAELPAPRRARG
jgi:cytochrome c551/c552